MTIDTVVQIPLCACGCGATTKWNNRWKRFNTFLFGHHSKVQPTGADAHRWKGGVTTHGGYVLVAYPTHPRAAGNGYVRRCILVAEGKLGRPLTTDEVVHHINGIRDDDRPENIEVMPSQGAHLARHNRERRNANAKLTDEQVAQVRALRLKLSNRKIGQMFGVSGTTIDGIMNGHHYKSAP